MAYLPLSTANLPDPVIDPAQGASPEDYFNTVLWTGDGSASKAVTGVGFEPSLVWTKGRNVARHHWWFDQVRGAEKWLQSSNTDPEADVDAGLISFDSDGFTYKYEANNGFNTTNDTYASWNWKANGSGVSNNAGSITSTVSANTTSGFSVVKYGGTGSAATVGHGLDQAPEMVIVKSMEGAFSWSVFHTSLGGTKNIFLNLTNAASTDSSHWNNTDPTSTVFSVGTNNGTNDSRYDHIAYCFHSVEGFSKFGSYTGNGSTDGAFVYTGFRPSWILFKRSDGGTHHWRMFDSTRSTFNDVDDYLTASSSVAEAVGKDVDFVSNGFKVRTSDSDLNLSGGTYIYMAFAENPFKYSNAR